MLASTCVGIARALTTRVFGIVHVFVRATELGCVGVSLVGALVVRQHVVWHLTLVNTRH